MISRPAHAIAGEIAGAIVHVALRRDPADGSAGWAISFVSAGSTWTSRYIFETALVLSDAMGARFAG